MNAKYAIVCGFFSLAIFTNSLRAAPPAAAAGDDAKAAAAKWLNSLDEQGLVLVEKTADGGFAGRRIAGSKSIMFVLHKPGWYVTLGFSEMIAEDTPLKTVRKRLKFVALDKLPTPGLDVPGWDIKPRTPVSSFRDGVEITGYGEGRIQLRIRTGFFALYGRNPNVLVPADAPSPP